jgi:hypothetical protein
MSDVADVLRRARDLYAANPSHCDADRYPEYGTYCPLTAVWETAGFGMPRGMDAQRFLLRAAGTRAIPDWNAENSTETVLAAFDKAITEADNA